MKAHAVFTAVPEATSRTALGRAESAQVTGCARRCSLAGRAVGVVGRRRVAGRVQPGGLLRARGAARRRPGWRSAARWCGHRGSPSDTAGPVVHPGQRDRGHRHPAAPRRPPGPRRPPPRCARCRPACRRPPRRGRGPRRAGWRRLGRWSRVYLPVSQPPPSGDQGSRPRPFSRQAGTISHSISRASRLYMRLQGHRPGQCRALGDVDGLLHLPAGEVRQPGVAHLAGADASSKKPSVSSTGVSGSQACTW